MPILKSPPKIYLVSACLTGLATRYDGKSKKCHRCVDAIAQYIWIPFCPEQLGGLSTPRVAADLVGGDGEDVLEGKAKIITRKGEDVTGSFIRGAQMTLEIANNFDVKAVLMKEGSPSCGVTRNGVTAALLKAQGYTLIEY